MKNSPILFMSPGCGACIEQKKILDDYFSSKGKSVTLSQINVDRFPDKFKFIKVTPTWAFPIGNQKYMLHPGIISEPSILVNSRKSGFGNVLPQLKSLSICGKTFPDGKEFNVPSSFYNEVEDKWGTGNDTLNAGIGGYRSLGPENIEELYSAGYYNNIRMAHPSDQLGTALYLNRTCNKTGSTLESPGMLNGPNPQIDDNTTGFGNKYRRSRFGSLYKNSMGPAYNHNPLIKENVYSGGVQNEGPRPQGVDSPNTFIGNAPLYGLSFGKKSSKLSNTLFGSNKKTVKKKKKVVIGEGSEIKLTGKKIKVKNPKR